MGRQLRPRIAMASFIAIGWAAFQIYIAGFGVVDTLIQRSIHVALAVALALLVYPARREKGSKPQWFDVLLAVVALSSAVYMVAIGDRLTSRIAFVDKVTFGDLFFGLATVLLVVEAARRTTGIFLPLVAGVFIAYAFLGPYMPVGISHRGISLTRFVDLQFLSATGLLGVATGASAEYIFYFVLFSAFLEASGAGKLFVDLAFRLTGRMRGGPAKVAVVGSSLMGTINGSAAANVVGTGVFTIPLMKKAGYEPSFAGAVEAVASTGGQLMPPIMGAGAFVMAEMLGLPYAKVAIAAIIPSLLYYLAIFLMVDFKARKEGLAIAEEDLPEIKGTRYDWHLFLPLFVLIYYIFAGYSLMTAAFRAIILLVLVSLLRRSTRLGFRGMLRALEAGPKQAIAVAIPCATAGLIIGVVTYSGLAAKLSELIVKGSGGNLVVALLLVMAGCLVFGMGMPTTAAYIMGAVLLAPSLVNLGVPVLAAHFFVFYFAIISTITPPVALASYAAAGIAEAPMGKLSWTALQLGIVAFIVPFAFVFNPALLVQGSVAEIVRTTATGALSTLALAGAVVGYFLADIPRWLRPVFFAGGVLLILPDVYTDLVGLFLFLGGFAAQLRTSRLASKGRTLSQG